MCVVSMIGDHYGEKWEPYKKSGGIPWPYHPPFPTIYPTEPPPQSLDALELAKLRKEVEEMKELLKRAIDYDKRNNEPHCEQEEKMKFLRRVAESVGISLDDVLGTP